MIDINKREEQKIPVFVLYLFTFVPVFLILLCVIFLTHIYVLFVTVLTLWVAPPEMFFSWYRI